jgi:ATP-dependent DNA helicase RecQ
MKNQVDQLNARGIKAYFLNSSLSKSESTKVKKQTLNGEVKLLYVAPESLTKEENIAFFQKVNLSFVAIDEVHCISEWGHDFRPEYRKIKSIIGNFGKLPVIALTATATPKVQIDIQKNLQMEDASIFKSSFHRENLFYEVRPKVDSKKALIRYVKSFAGQSGIVYCLSRKKVVELAELLQVNDVKALPYHAGLDPSTRVHNQDAFLNEDTDVIVATIAFGMGIDKPDVRFVVHYDAPKSLEGYYQETGRGGRDGKMSNCMLFYSYADILKLEKFNKDKAVTERDTARLLLEEVASYSESSTCRTKQLLHYFGEHFEENCGHCDNCKSPKNAYEGKSEVLLALEAVQQTGERFPIKHVVEVIRGSEAKGITSYDHDQLAVYGKGKDKIHGYWYSTMRQVLIQEFLEKDYDNYGVVKLTQKGKDYLASPYSVSLTIDQEYPAGSEEEKEDKVSHNHAGYDKVLFDILMMLRKKIADQKELPPYVIFQEDSLEEMALTYPTKIEALTQIFGVGNGKAQKFGKPFLEAISTYVKENDIIVASDLVVKTAGQRSKNKIQIIQAIDNRQDLEEFAENLGLKFDKLITELEHICHAGTKVNIDYFIDTFLDEEKQDDIYDYFMEADTDDINQAMEELGDDYSLEEVRLMRIKFMSEVAN